MRWKTRLPYNNPKQGDKSTTEEFAYLPTLMNDDTWVWMEKYCTTWEYRDVDWYGSKTLRWSLIKKETKD